MTTHSRWDLIIIGAGPGGYVAALRAAQLGKKVALVEEKHLGGVCLNWGCIPTKALLKSADLWDEIRHAEDFGITVQKPQVDIARMVQRSRRISEQLSKGVHHLLKKSKVSVITGRATLKQPGVVSVTSDQGCPSLHEAPAVIVATGARARSLPGIEPDGSRIWTAREAMTPKSLPASMVIIGSGAIGMEFASFYSRLGSQVTVVEMQDRILPQEDAEISQLAQQAFEKQGIACHTQTTVDRVRVTPHGVDLWMKREGKELPCQAECIILAVGIVGHTEGLGLEKTRAHVDRGHIVTDGYGQTAEPGLYAIGDVASPPWLAHKASHEAVVCVDHIFLGQAHPLKPHHIPSCIYSSPQIAHVGLTEAQAQEQGYQMRIGRFPYMGNGKALALGLDQGLIKTIFDQKTGALLGAHLIGGEVTELIHGFALGQTLEATEEDFMHTVFPHPTLSEMMHESVLHAYDRALHI